MRANYGRPILLSGGSSCLGQEIALSLLGLGAEVRLLLPPGAPAPPAWLGGESRAIWVDAWNEASLRGQGRAVGLVLHCLGSLQEDVARGHTARRLNFIAARNVVNMAVQDGVPHFLLLSSAPAPWLPPAYRRAKRAAERHLERSGLRYGIVRAPLAYRPGSRRPLLFRTLSFLAGLPLLANWGPLPRHLLALVVARIAFASVLPVGEASAPPSGARVYAGRDLRRLLQLGRDTPWQHQTAPAHQPGGEWSADGEPPFGWTPAGLSDGIR